MLNPILYKMNNTKFPIIVLVYFNNISLTYNSLICESYIKLINP